MHLINLNSSAFILLVYSYLCYVELSNFLFCVLSSAFFFFSFVSFWWNLSDPKGKIS